MAKQYLQTQDILNRVFDNNTGTLKAKLGYYDTQDYINAVFDGSSDALRINVIGGGSSSSGGSSSGVASTILAVSSVDQLPTTAETGAVGLVVSKDGVLSFYQWDSSAWNLLVTVEDGSNSGSALTEDQEQALDWLVNNLERLKELSSIEYLIQVDDLMLTPDTGEPVILTVQGAEQDIDDDGDTDGDVTTHYRIDIEGYVLGIETYASNDAVQPDRYYTRIIYEPNGTAKGTSHIYLTVEEYEYITGLENGKNLLRIAYI